MYLFYNQYVQDKIIIDTLFKTNTSSKFVCTLPEPKYFKYINIQTTKAQLLQVHKLAYYHSTIILLLIMMESLLSEAHTCAPVVYH